MFIRLAGKNNSFAILTLDVKTQYQLSKGPTGMRLDPGATDWLGSRSGTHTRGGSVEFNVTNYISTLKHD